MKSETQSYEENRHSSMQMIETVPLKQSKFKNHISKIRICLSHQLE